MKRSFLLGLMAVAIAIPGLAHGDVRSSAHHAVGGKIRRVYGLKTDPDFTSTRVVVLSGTESKVRGEGTFSTRHGKYRKFRYWAKVNNLSFKTRDVGYEIIR